MRRSFRERQRPDRYGYDVSDFIYLAPTSNNIQPKSVGISFFSHAISEDPQQFPGVAGIPEWETSMTEEYSSLMKNHTWDFVPLPKGRKLVRCSLHMGL